MAGAAPRGTHPEAARTPAASQRGEARTHGRSAAAGGALTLMGLHCTVRAQVLCTRW